MRPDGRAVRARLLAPQRWEPLRPARPLRISPTVAGEKLEARRVVAPSQRAFVTHCTAWGYLVPAVSWLTMRPLRAAATLGTPHSACLDGGGRRVADLAGARSRDGRRPVRDAADPLHLRSRDDRRLRGDPMGRA